MERKDMQIFWNRNILESGHLEDQEGDPRMVLGYISGKLILRMGVGYN
jgi:hypothetical protein